LASERDFDSKALSTRKTEGILFSRLLKMISEETDKTEKGIKQI